MSKIAQFFKRRWEILLFVLVVLVAFSFHAYTSEAYRFSLQAIKQTEVFGDGSPIVLIQRMRSVYFSAGSEETKVRLYAFDGNTKGWFVLSLKKEQGSWCVASVFFNGEEINSASLATSCGASKP